MGWFFRGPWRLPALVILAAVGCPASQAAQAPPAPQVQMPQAPPPPGGITQVAAMPGAVGPRATQEITVRAWVNGRPIFDQDLLGDSAIELLQISQMAEPQRTARKTDILKKSLQRLIDNELILQDAYRKLKENKAALEKLRELAEKEFDRSLPKRKKQFGGEERFQLWLSLQGLTLETYRKKFEQMFIANQYIYSRTGPTEDAIGQPDIREYYEQHRNEFQTVDRVEWQDLFIAVGPRHPTLQDVHLFAEQLVARLRRGEDFASLLAYDDGIGATNKGLGIGQQRGQIKPPEVEAYIWNMRDGDVGPPLDLATGVHVFRLVKRTYAGPLPYDEKVQARIRDKLKEEVRERMRKQVIRELTAHAVIQVERHPLP
jgi:hypothetical protein